MTSSTKRIGFAVVLIWFLIGAQWLMIGAQWLIYGWIAQVSIATPPLWLLFGFLVTLIGVAIYVAWFGIAQLVFGPRRLLVVSLILFALTPAIWSATFIVDLRYRAVERESLAFNFPTRAIGYWAASIADIQAIWTKPARTEGKYVRLYAEKPFDNTEQLVEEMDKHIIGMAERLGCDLPDVKSRWVRGKLLGFSGRAFLSWGICDTDETKLTYVDRHEVAHTLITIVAGAGQHPPMLLAEGWAQVNSADVDSDIKQLYADLASGSHCPIKDLLGPKTYGASIGKAYSYGGPFCSWLLAEFGGEKFYAIYSTIRRDSNKKRCQVCSVEKVL